MKKKVPVLTRSVTLRLPQKDYDMVRELLGEFGNTSAFIRRLVFDFIARAKPERKRAKREKRKAA